MRRKRTWLYIILLIPIVILLYGANGVKADSGFDVGYDSGGGGWSSSDSSGSSSSSGDSFFAFESFIAIVIIAIIIVLANKTNGGDGGLPLTEEEIKKYIPDFDLEKFTRDRFKDYVDIQNAWMSFDYDGLREKVTDELYNQYKMQLDSLELSGKKNIMKDFELKDIYVVDVKNENDTLEIVINMIVSFYDYIECNGKVERGSDTKKIIVWYEMTFICNKDSIKRCPNCGAEITDDASQVCKYCRATISRTGNKWVLSKKENIRQY